MTAYIATFFLSFALGFGSHAWHARQVEKALARLRREKDSVIKMRDAEISRLRGEKQRLRAEKDNVQVLSDCADAYRKGKEVGRYSPATQAEVFARNFENRKGNTTFVRTDKQQTA